MPIERRPLSGAGGDEPTTTEEEGEGTTMELNDTGGTSDDLLGDGRAEWRLFLPVLSNVCIDVCAWFVVVSSRVNVALGSIVAAMWGRAPWIDQLSYG